MRKTIKTLIWGISISFLIASSVSAHPGNTDKYGGHYDHSTGLYHFHNSGTVESSNIPSNNTTTTSAGIDFLKKPLSQNIKSWDRARLENTYVENMDFYEAENKKLESQINMLNSEKSTLNNKYETLKEGFAEEKNKSIKYENTIKTYEIRTNKLIIQRNLSLLATAISLLGFTLYKIYERKLRA